MKRKTAPVVDERETEARDIALGRDIDSEVRERVNAERAAWRRDCLREVSAWLMDHGGMTGPEDAAFARMLAAVASLEREDR